MKRIIAVVLSVVMLVGLCACGAKNEESGSASKTIEGDLVTVIQNIYATADLDADTKEAFTYHMIEAIPEDPDMQAYLLGTNELEYAECAYAQPMMNAQAYQLNLFRLADGADVEAFKAKAESSFDTGKWVCVTPEKVATVNVGNVVMFVCGTTQVVDAIVAAFQAQGK